MEKQLTPDEIIDAIGGTSEVARLCEVSGAAVSQWRKDGIPNARLMFLRLARSEVFVALESTQKPIETAEAKRDGGIRLPMHTERIK